MRRGWQVLLVLTILLVLPLISAENQVVINSKDWKDVSSGMLYAKLRNLDVHYVVEETHGVQLSSEVLNKNLKEVLLVESNNNLFIRGYEGRLRQDGFQAVKFISNTPYETNLKLAEKLVSENQINSFIVMDDAYPYNILSVAPYALTTKSYVLFVNDGNLDAVYNFLSQNADNILLYGRMSNKIQEQLSIFSPDVINTGNKIGDNIEIVKRFEKEKSPTQIIFTNGEFIEPSFFNNEFPVLFIGTTNIPSDVMEYIYQSNAKAGVVIGYDLYTNAKTIRDATGMRIFLKYGQGREEQIYALDIFPLPKSEPEFALKAINYNTLTNQVEVIYENTGNTFVYLQALSHKFKVNGVEVVSSIGDEEAFFLDVGDTKVILYGEVDLSSFSQETVLVESKVLFGEIPESLEKLFTKETKLNFVSYNDESSINVLGVKYNKAKKQFEVVVENLGDEETYVDLEIFDLFVEGQKTIFGGDITSIGKGKKKTITIDAELTEEDLNANKLVNIRAWYGTREDALVKTSKFSIDLEVVEGFSLGTAGVVLLYAVIILLFFLMRKKKRKH